MHSLVPPLFRHCELPERCFSSSICSPAPISSGTAVGSLVATRALNGDNEATRHVRIEVILIVWLGLATLLVVEWVGLWIN